MLLASLLLALPLKAQPKPAPIPFTTYAGGLMLVPAALNGAVPVR